MKIPRPATLRARLTLWYVAVLAVLLVIYAALVFAFQYAVLTRQLFHDEMQDVITAEGLLYFDAAGSLQLHQDYYSRPQSHLLVDRLMEVRDPQGNSLYRSPTLHGIPLGGPALPGEGVTGFDERIVRLEDGNRVFIVSHIHSLDGRVLLIRLAYSLAPLQTRMLQFLTLLVITIPLALALAAGAGERIARRALQPLGRMTSRAQGITANNLTDRLEVQDPEDELGQMARVFNHLLDRLEQAFGQLQRFTADAAHELRTPLAALRTVGEVTLQRDATSEEYRDALANILEETARLNQTIESLLLLAKAEAADPGQCQTSFIVSDLVDEVIDLLEIVIEERHLSVLQEDVSAGKVTVYGNRDLLRTAILNVLHNALKFSPEEGLLRISYKRSESPIPSTSVIIQDEGPGIAPDEHPRIFERFFTSSSAVRAPQSGTGLGLAIAKLVVERTGGTIRFDDTISRGAKCIITLPLA